MTTRHLKMLLALVLVSLTFSASALAHHHQAATQEDAFAAVNEKMMQDMHSLALSGDAEYDYVAGMLPHHQGAVDMAQVLLDKGSDPTLLALAKDVISAQEQEITFLDAWLEKYGDPQPGEQAQAIVSAWQRINQRMMQDMHQPGSGDVNRDFAVAMIPHHVAAIDMSYVLLAYAQDEALQQLARDVIREQEREIRELNTWLERQGATAESAGHGGH